MLGGLGVLAFAPSYAALAPLAGSESPEAVLLIVPVIAGVLLWWELVDAPRRGKDLVANAIFASPLALVLLVLLLWFPAKLSYFYWVYRFDLLAVPIAAAISILLVFGLPALWRAKTGLLVLVLGWPPILDLLISRLADPLASLQARGAEKLLSPLHLAAHLDGQSFVLRGGDAISIAAPCSGLVGATFMLALGGLVAYLAEGRRRARLWWLAWAVAATLAANVLRIALVVGLASSYGLDAGVRAFHASAGVAVFAVVLLGMLLLLPSFRLRLRLTRTGPPPAPVELSGRSVATIGGILLAGAVFVAWASAGLGAGPGLFRGVQRITSANLLPGATGYRSAGREAVPAFRFLFGSDATSALYHLRASGGRAVAAQVVVAPTYFTIRRYGVLDCFVFHRHHVYATHVLPLPDGGTLDVVDVNLDGQDVVAMTWMQPVLLDGTRAWRRVVLFSYLSTRGSTSGAGSATANRDAGMWLLDRLSPYGGVHPPARFHAPELEVASLAARLATGGAR